MPIPTGAATCPDFYQCNKSVAYFFFFFEPWLFFGAIKSHKSYLCRQPTLELRATVRGRKAVPYVLTRCNSPSSPIYRRLSSKGLPSRSVWAKRQPPAPCNVPPTENGQVPSPNLKCLHLCKKSLLSWASKRVDLPRTEFF